MMFVNVIDTILRYSYCFCLFYEGKVWAVFCITFKSLLEMTVNKKTENKSLLEEVSMSFTNKFLFKELERKLFYDKDLTQSSLFHLDFG